MSKHTLEMLAFFNDNATLEFLASSYVRLYPGKILLARICSRAMFIAGIPPDELKPYSPYETTSEKYTGLFVDSTS